MKSFVGAYLCAADLNESEVEKLGNRIIELFDLQPLTSRNWPKPRVTTIDGTKTALGIGYTVIRLLNELTAVTPELKVDEAAS